MNLRKARDHVAFTESFGYNKKHIKYIEKKHTVAFLICSDCVLKLAHPIYNT